VSKHSALIGSGKIKVAVLDVTTGKQIKQYSLSADPDATSIGRSFCVSSCTSSPFLAWSERPYRALKTNLLGTNKVSSLPFESHSGEEIEDISMHFPCHPDALPHFLVHLRSRTKQWAEIFQIDIQTGEVSKAYSLPALGEGSAFFASNIDANVYFTRATETEVFLYSSASHGVLGRWPRHRKVSSNPLHIASEVVSRGKSGFAIRVAETSTVGEWALVRNGENVWTRPEMLANVVAAAWADDSGGDATIQAIEEEAHSNPLTAYIHRVKRHTQDMKALLSWLQSLPQSVLSSLSAGDADRDKGMTGNKILILGTSNQYLLALDANAGGTLRWIQNDFADMKSRHAIKSLHVDGEHVTVYLSDGSVGAILNATDGSIVGLKEQLPPFERMLQVPGRSGPATFRVSADGTPQVAEDLIASAPVDGNSIVTISDNGEAIGWTIGQSARKLWTLRPSSGFKLVNAVGRAAHDPVASIGNVLGDRSVLYKYLSPNLMVLTALSANALTMYLIESVTGAVLHTSTHEGIDPRIPVVSVLSENWFAYSFLASDSADSVKGYQLIISELYESDIANDRGVLGATTNYSSFDAGATRKPYVISQGFALPERISHMAVTQTNQGITTRQLLCTLPDSNAVVGIPRHVLAPRRPVDREATALEAEEGLFKYSPTLDLDPKWYLTHSREVIGVEKVISSPSLLESTSLVFAFGHDIFGTRVSPSGAFDILDKSFNKMQLALTVIALAAGTGALAPLVKKTQVQARWKGQ
jgi:ER membrane protein complex subunit 1